MGVNRGARCQYAANSPRIAAKKRENLRRKKPRWRTSGNQPFKHKTRAPRRLRFPSSRLKRITMDHASRKRIKATVRNISIRDKIKALSKIQHPEKTAPERGPTPHPQITGYNRKAPIVTRTIEKETRLQTSPKKGQNKEQRVVCGKRVFPTST